MKHTKGPWIWYNGADEDETEIKFSIGAVGGQLAENIPSIHNAYLISAAPEMLEALEEILTNLTEISGIETGTTGPVYKSMEFCRKALAKARGES